MLIDRGFIDPKYYETDVLGLFRVVFQKVNCGHHLLTHPLMENIRPDITPYKTVLLLGVAGTIDIESAILIGRVIRYTEDLYRLRDIPIYKKWGKATREDFQFIDLSVIERALGVEEMGR